MVARRVSVARAAGTTPLRLASKLASLAPLL